MPVKNFIKNLVEQCQKNPKNIALPESLDPRTYQAAEMVLKIQAVDNIYFYCSEAQGMEICQSKRIDLRPHQSHIHWLYDSEKHLTKNVQKHIEEILKKKNKPIDHEKTNTLSQHPLYQASYSLASGQVDASISGAVYTTGEVIRAGLMGVGLQKSLKTVSGSFIMNRPEDEKTYIFGDCGVVIDPSAEQMADIAFSCVETWNTVLKNNCGEAKVAFLSFSTKGSAVHPMTEKVIQATKIFKERYPHILSDGEFQFDAAFDKEIGQRKAPGNKISGKANIFIFPNLDAGNIAYKLTQRLAGFDAYGPILQGLAKPYSDLSRGASPEDIAGSIYINSLRSEV